jgi:alkylated DNA nucleotide flippase Atl1
VFKSVNMTRQKRIRKLADALKEADVDVEVTHGQLAKIVGLSECPNELFQAAHRLANKESGAYWESVRGIGYVRLEDTEVDGVANKYRKRVRRQAKTGRNFVTNIVIHSNKLSDEDQRRMNREIGLMQTIESMTRQIADKERLERKKAEAEVVKLKKTLNRFIPDDSKSV